jgi:hypothetical protein
LPTVHARLPSSSRWLVAYARASLGKMFTTLPIGNPDECTPALAWYSY